jgi:hypothetical protein
MRFPDLNSPPFGGRKLSNESHHARTLPILSRKLPPCSIVRPTETKNIAIGAVKFLIAIGLFIGQSQAFFDLLNGLASGADAARRGF